MGAVVQSKAQRSQSLLGDWRGVKLRVELFFYYWPKHRVVVIGVWKALANCDKVLQIQLVLAVDNTISKLFPQLIRASIDRNRQAKSHNTVNIHVCVFSFWEDSCFHLLILLKASILVHSWNSKVKFGNLRQGQMVDAIGKVFDHHLQQIRIQKGW